jgi:quinol monooxygenase YgiN
MQVLIVHLQVKPEAIEAFQELAMENARNSVQEPGIARFDVLQQSDDPTRFVLVEVYRDEDAPTRHKETAHYLAWRDRVGDMLAEPRYGIRYQTIFPGDEAW